MKREGAKIARFFLSLDCEAGKHHYWCMTLDMLAISEEEAARRLKLKVSALRRYAREGRLDTFLDKRKKRFYYTEQILNLEEMRSRGEKSTLPMNQRIDGLSRRLVVLERMFRVLCDGIGLAHLHYQPTDMELSSLYEASLSLKGSYTMRKPSRALLSNWLAVVPLLGAHEFRRLKGMYPYDHDPWKIFHVVTEELQSSVSLLYAPDKMDRDAPMWTIGLGLCARRIADEAVEFIVLEESGIDPRERISQKLKDSSTPDPTTITYKMIEQLRSTTPDPSKAVVEIMEIAKVIGTEDSRR